MSRLRGLIATGLLLGLLALDTIAVRASGGHNGEGSPTPPPTSQGTGKIVLNTLEAGAGGTYTPMPANDVPSGRIDPRNPIYVPPPPDPQGKPCPQVTTFHVNPGDGVIGPGIPSGNILDVVTIYPTFTRNAVGGFDGSDPAFNYALKNAVPPGGDPAATSLGSPATAATIGGHIVGVDAWLQQRGTWQDATPGVPPYGGACQGAAFAFTAPFLAGDAPPPVPPRTVLVTPPFALGSALMAEVTGRWRIGHIVTLPGPANDARTYVHIPTCAWMDTGVPTSMIGMHAVKTTVENGVTLFLVYNLLITPGPVTWDWGDESTSQTATVMTQPPSSLPVYDPSTQTWTDPCDVSHAYSSVSGGRTITASETFSVAITVSWNDGVSDHTAAVPCDPVTGGPCQLTVGAANGWTSGPHPVDQIEPVPYLPPAP